MHDLGPEGLTAHPAVSRRAQKHWPFRFRDRRKISPKRPLRDFFSTLLGVVPREDYGHRWGTGVFWGSLAGRDEGFRDLLADWAKDSSSEAIRLWAQDGIRAIEERLPSVQEWEEETEPLSG